MNNAKNIVSGGLKGTVKGLAATIPGGSLLVSIVDEIQNGIFQDRFNEWKESVEERLGKLEDSIINQLPQNDIFATVLLISAQLALKTNKEKIKLLANAVANSATTKLPEERVVILLNCIEKYTIPHLMLLRFLQNPKEYNPSESIWMGAPITIYDDYYPKRDKSLDKVIIRDLYSDGLISTDSLNTTMTKDGMLAKKTTDLGDNLIEFFGIEQYKNE